MPARVMDVEVAGRTYRITVESLPGDNRFRVTCDGVSRMVDVGRPDSRTLSLVHLEDDTRSEVATVFETASEGELEIHIDGTTTMAVVDRDRRRFVGATTEETDGPQQLVAPMPGKVVRHLVAVGDEVIAKQGVIVVEAMKMENEIAASRNGRVVAISVEEGESVEAGTVLVVIE